METLRKSKGNVRIKTNVTNIKKMFFMGSVVEWAWLRKKISELEHSSIETSQSEKQIGKIIINNNNNENLKRVTENHESIIIDIT